MLKSSTLNLDINHGNNWCCHIDCNQEAEVIGFRKHADPKSVQKSEKTKKTSLKKRSGSANSVQEPKAQKAPHQNKQESTPPKPSLIYRQAKPPEPAIIFQQIQLASTPPPTANFIKYTPDKSYPSQKKITFIYNNKLPTTKYQSLGVNDLESFKQGVKIVKNQNVSFKKTNANHTSGFQSQCRVDPFKSTQYSNMASERVGTEDDSPSLSKQFRFDEMSPTTMSNKRDSKQPLGFLSSRKETVLSINGDTQSQQSFAVEDYDSSPFMKFNSIQNSRIVENPTRFVYGSLKNSISL